MTERNSDQVVLVTGAGGLIGKCVADRLESEGAVVVRTDIGNDSSIKCDIRNKNSVKEAISVVIDKYGRLDGLVNCAYPRSESFGASFFDVSYDEFCENVSWQLGGTFLVSQQAALQMKEQGGGSIVNFGSIYGVVAPDFSVYKGTEMTTPVEYAAVKSGVIHLTKYMARYLKGTGVRINCVSPGGILDSQPETFLERYAEKCSSKGMLDASDLESTILFLLSPQSKAVTGQNIIVDDGFTL